MSAVRLKIQEDLPCTIHDVDFDVHASATFHFTDEETSLEDFAVEEACPLATDDAPPLTWSHLPDRARLAIEQELRSLMLYKLSQLKGVSPPSATG